MRFSGRILVLVILISLPFISSISSNRIPLVKAEERALKYEIIELDIGIRNAASMISTGNTRQLINSLVTLRAFQTANSIRHRESFSALVKKLEAADLLPHFQAIHREAQELQAYLLNENKKGRAIDWSNVERSFNKVLTGCRNIHMRTDIR